MSEREGRSYSLYILRCADGSYYTGIACDVDARLSEHATGKRGAKYLRGRAPFELVFSGDAGSRGEAQALEYRVKKLKRTEKRALIAGRLELDQLRS